jgi:hypothetical protein
MQVEAGEDGSWSRAVGGFESLLAEGESGVRQELQTWLWTLGVKRCCVLGGAGWDTWCLGCELLSWRLLGDGEGQREAGKGVWGASGRSVQGEKMRHMLLAL